MATELSTFHPTGENLGATVNATSSSAEIVIGTNRIFLLRTSGASNVKFGNTGMGAAAATDWIIPANNTVPDMFDMGDAVDRIRIYNPGGAGITYTIMFLGRD
jgi:hypothetical protein